MPKPSSNSPGFICHPKYIKKKLEDGTVVLVDNPYPPIELHGKPVLVPHYNCSDCKAKVNVFALVIRGEVRILCVQCLGEIAGRWYSSIRI